MDAKWERVEEIIQGRLSSIIDYIFIRDPYLLNNSATLQLYKLLLDVEI